MIKNRDAALTDLIVEISSVHFSEHQIKLDETKTYYLTYVDVFNNESNAVAATLP